MKKEIRLYTLILILALAPLATQAAPPPMETALTALQEGDARPAEELLKSLSKRQRRSFEHRLLAARVALSRMDLQGAREELDEIRDRDITDSVSYHRVSNQVQIAERMLGSMQPIVLLDSVAAGQLDYLLQRQQRDFVALGSASSTDYVAPGGQVRWTVLPNEAGGTTFGLVTRLGDGTWDEANTQVISINGLDPTGAVSYPYLMPDGQTLYFSYSGPGTLGGADIYVSRYAPESRTLLVPQQLPIPINSSADDYAYIMDEGSGIAAFVTERCSPAGTGAYVVYRSAADGVASAFLDSIPVRSTGGDIADLLSVSGERYAPESVEAEPLFFIGSRQICSADDLKSSVARTTLGRYMRLRESYENVRTRLAQTRQDYINETRPISREEILELEQQLKAHRLELRALRNEVIAQEINL